MHIQPHTINYMLKRSFYLSLLTVLMGMLPAHAQVSVDSPLYKIMMQNDSLLFEEAFNRCNTAVLEKIVADDFEFYHDKGGITNGKAAFIQSIQNNICKLSYRPIRKLEPGSMEVYPLTQNGKLYGAIQNGRHSFSAQEKDKPVYLTSRAKFTHVWMLENGEWKFIRGLSYDHQEPNAPVVPDFENTASINTWIQQHHVPALGIGLIHKGQLQEIKMYGELAQGKPAPYNAIFNVASITKTVTTMLTLRLVSAGKWDLDEPLYHYWTDPDVKADPRAKQLTTRHILNQASGFPNWRWNLQDGKLAFQFTPGEKYQYSGEGFEYLLHALEKKFHQPLQQLAEEWIFRPLGMHDTYYTWNKNIDSSRFALPHDKDGNVLPFQRNAQASAADLMKTTIGDYAKLLLAAQRGDGLSKAVAEEMVRPATKVKERSYVGLGWFLYQDIGDGEYAISHGGSDPGVRTIAILLPKSGEGIIIYTNGDNGTQLYIDLIRHYLGAKGQAIVDIETK